MKKMPCLFIRVFNGRGNATITETVTPGCEWVLDGEGVASRKWDGTASMVKDGVLYKRLDCKRGKTPPDGAIPCQDADSVTGHWPHWIKVNPSEPSNKWFMEAWNETGRTALANGTYELIGPRINGNPESCDYHTFVRHGDMTIDIQRSFAGIKSALEKLNIEGVVFAHPDGRMCKIRRDDFGFDWPVKP